MTDSMFLFEIVVEELKSYINCKEFYIRSQFADVFTLSLKDPNEMNALFPKRIKKKELVKTKVRDTKTNDKKPTVDPQIQTGQSVLFVYNVDLLMSRMKNYNMELSVWHKDYLEDRLGSTHIPWSYVFIDFLSRLHRKEGPLNVTTSGEYNIFDEINSKRMASMKLNMKLSYLKDKITTEFRSLSASNPQTFIYTGINSQPTNIVSTVKKNPVNTVYETGIIKTLYRGNKKFKESIPNKKAVTKIDEIVEDAPTEKCQTDEKEDEKLVRTATNNILTPRRSDTDIDKCKKIDVIRSKSCTSINRDQYNILNYIFGGNDGPFGNNVYCVGYFTVENNFTKASESSKASIKNQSSEKSEEPKEKYKFRICDSECPSRKEDNTCSQSVCSLDLPADAANLISITKCKQVECNERQHRDVPPPPDERILLKISNSSKECCQTSEIVEKVVGGMKAKMKFEGQPCFCSCECTFGFTKKTTYCAVCGGYEITGEDLPTKPTEDINFPCPVYHKLIDRNKLKTWSTSGSESKKKPEDSQRSFKAGSKTAGSDRKSGVPDKSVESEKESKKGKKKKRDDKFKFNYGYQGIPPQIGHSQCTFPCTGTLGAVPKQMGWLWTAEDVPGMKVANGWKPGAISKRLLRKLNKVKIYQPGSEKARPAKRSKKRVEEKPTLIISKKDGEYRVEMQVASEKETGAEYKPLVYKIANERNIERQKVKERHRRRAIRKAVKEIWSDPYHPEICEQICYRTYQQAIGVIPYDPNNPDCICTEEEETETMDSCSCDDIDVSSVSSSEVEWEIHFSPPISRNINISG